MRRLYELYHTKRKIQKRIITESDFTYQNLLFLVRKISLRHKKVLDIGCGVGTIDFYLANKGARVKGLDISQNAVMFARMNAEKLGLGKKVKFEVANFPHKGVKGRFDVIICSEVLEHLENDFEAVAVMKQLLKRNGIIIASSPSLNSPLFKIGVLKNFDRKVGHLRRYNEDSFRLLFETNGLRVSQIRSTEGIIRNFLFTNSVGGYLLRILNKWPFSLLITAIDNLTVPVFGESDIFLIAQKK
jgi:2-polyprenyl-3-methyl-5-hydroxy-6-metoxy-1,4-benzoquinol methylase